MKTSPIFKLLFIRIAVVAICFFSQIQNSVAQFSQESWIGFWKGDLHLGEVSLRLIIEVKPVIESSTPMQLKSSLDVPAQGAKGIGFNTSEINKNKITWVCSAIGATCTGERKDSITIEAIWKQGGQEFPLTLKKSAQRFSTKPQTPKPPFGYITRTAQFSHPSGKLSFGGTLTVPNDSLLQLFEKNQQIQQQKRENSTFTPTENAAASISLNSVIAPRIASHPYIVRGKTEGITRYPVVLLISGSGTQDRDETIGDHKPFAVWADYLSLRGVAALRVDDRGMNASKGEPEFLQKTTTESLVEDAMAAIEWLKTQPDIDTNFIFLMGHSEGANIALKVAKKSNNIRGVITLAGMVEKGVETSIYQLKPIWKANGADEETVESLANLTRTCATASARYKDVNAAKKFAQDSLLKHKAYTPAFKYLNTFEVKQTKQKNILGYLSKRIGEDYQQPWIQYFMQYDPSVDFKNNDVALLMIQGKKDKQIDAVAAKALSQQLEAEGKYVQYREFGQLNHMMQHADSGFVDEYFTLEETLAGEVPAITMSWLQVQLTGR